MLTTKRCCTCKLELSTDNFTINRSRKSGFSDRCKPCRKIQKRDFYLRNKARLAPKFREYYLSVKEQHNERARRAYREKHAERLARQAEYQSRNKEFISAARRSRYAADPMKVKLRELKRTIASQQFKTQPVTTAVWREELELHGYKCAYCGCHAPVLELDHVVPLARGGIHDRTNIVPACKSCNSSKGAKLLLEIALTPGLKIHQNAVLKFQE